MEPDEIASIIRKVSSSSLSVDEYLRKHRVPFSRPQYFRYKARLAASGVEALVDGRTKGNYRKLTPGAEGFLRGLHSANPHLSLQQMCASLESALGIEVDRSTVSRFFKAVGEQIEWPRPEEPDRSFTSCGGFEIIGALALHLGWAKHTAEVIAKERERFKRTAAYRHERASRDRKGRNPLGQFTGEYNRREEIRLRRFASVEEKRGGKNFSRTGLFRAGEAVLQRKCLGILALPLITLNGTTRSADVPLGNALAHFCGYNYRHDTLDKFLRELKYLGISGRLLREQVGFWLKHWHAIEESPSGGLPFLCYYVDGNTKPLWSEKRVKQNKVTMLGRVMGCLEQVFVHDGFGHPVYMETYAGKAPVGEHILGLFEKIEEALEGPGPPLHVTRVIVMDAASNGVATLRAFAEQQRYHYITALDDNQWNPRKVRHEGRPKRYYFGEATLRDCLLELEDSRQKGYLVVVRAVRIDWDHGKRTVLITSLPKEAVGASLVVKAYFDRWPHEELQFRGMKSFACLNRVAGYGKMKLPDQNVRQRQKKIERRLAALRASLKVPLKAIADQEEKLAVCVERERRLRMRGQIVDGRRVLDEADRAALKSITAQIANSRERIRAVQSECGKSLFRLRRHEKEWLRLQGKQYVYRIDVELDQIMTFFRMALVNLSSWFLHECLGRSTMSLARFLHTILLLPATIELTRKQRRILLQRNPKDPEGMAAVELAINRLNKWQIRHLDGKRMEFGLIQSHVIST